MKLVYIIIVNYNLTESVKNLLFSIQQETTNILYKIIIVDNNSPERNIENLQSEFPDVTFEFLNTNYGFGHANNCAIKKYPSDYYLLLNPDTLVIDNCIFELYKFLEGNKEFGIISPLTLNENKTIQYTHRKFPNIFEEFMGLLGLQEISYRFIRIVEHRFRNRILLEPDFIYGSAMMIRKEVFERIGYFDEGFFLFAEETDLCYRLRKETKIKIGLLRNVKLVHAGGRIISTDMSLRIRHILQSKLIFLMKHYSPLKRNLLRFIISLAIVERIVFYKIISSDI